ncbi:MAG: hypothetical protein LBS89_01850 [Zoogloeaceae bacterium]|jgi:hypothetical protein|nr:hypothetical protein [Zoogloeaceae bacterium]
MTTFLIRRFALAGFLLLATGAAEADDFDCDTPLPPYSPSQLRTWECDTTLDLRECYYQPFYRAIRCDDAELGALRDEFRAQLAALQTIAARLSRPVQDYAKDSDWNQKWRNQGEALTASDRETLKTLYRHRLDELKSIAADFPADALFLGTKTRLVAKQYELTLQSYRPCDPGNFEWVTYCRSLGQLRVHKKGAQEPFAILNAPLVWIGGKHREEHGESHEYGEIVVGDFNFDGYEDVALDNGNRKMGGNFSDSDVYLFDPKQQAFIYSEALTDLSSEACQNNLFGFNPAQKRLYTACHDRRSRYEFTYKVVNNIPVLVEETGGEYGVIERKKWITEDAIARNAVGEAIYDYRYAWKYATRRLVKGKWRTIKVKYEYVKDEPED